MGETKRTVYMRSPYDFSDWTYEEESTRLLKKKIDDEEFKEYNPELTTVEEFRSELDKIGRVTRFETYIDFNSVFEVTRGSVIKDGLEHFFHIMYPIGKLYKGYVTGAISTILYTKIVEDSDG